MQKNKQDENWQVIVRLLPQGWQEKAKELGAITRQRKIKGADELLRVLLIHLADGCSLRETVARADQGKISSISDVALLKRLKASSEWFRLMSIMLLEKRGCEIKRPDWLSGYKIRSVDATVVSEPGSTGTDWRLHYSLELFGLQCDFFSITRQDVGETLCNFPVEAGDIVIGDRVYGTPSGFWHVKKNGGDFIVRFKRRSFSIFDPQSGQPFDLLKALRELNCGEIRDWPVEIRAANKEPMKIRICAIKKSNHATKLAIKKAIRTLKKKQMKIKKQNLEYNGYVIISTSIEGCKLTAKQIAQLYKLRWQIEIAFKRLKSIMGLGHLPKIDMESARAWLHGKIFVALLVQAIVDEGRFFSPWGYPL